MSRRPIGFWSGFLGGLGAGPLWRLLARVWSRKGGGNG